MKSNSQGPMVSVVIPTYNRGEWLCEAVQSVLQQTYTNYEIIVVDDGSTENLLQHEVLHHEKVRYFRNENHGVAYSRNFGIRHAQGKYVAFLDSDDFWRENKLDVQVAAMEESGAKWSQHCYHYYDDEKKVPTKAIDTYVYRNCPEKFIYCSFKVQTSCFMVERRAVIENQFGFDETKKFGEDAVFYGQMMRKYKLLCINEYLGFFRIRGSNFGMNAKVQMQSRVNCWTNAYKDEHFKECTTPVIRLAYRLCVFFSEITKNMNSAFLDKAFYALPWLLFKLEAKRLMAKS